MTTAAGADDGEREQLLEHLIRTRVAGDVATSRQSNLGNVHKMLARDPDYWFGLELDRPWTFAEVVAVVARRVGIDADHAREHGADRIDPELCVAGLEHAAEVLGRAAADRRRVMFATGHPTGLLPFYLPLVGFLRGAGCEVAMPAAERWVDVQQRRLRIRYVAGVATVGTGGDLLHTHAPEPMWAALAAGPRPDLVVGDHGWAGAAGQAGIETVGFADTNDPALFVGAEEQKVLVAVPLDDNVEPAHYQPLADFVLARATRRARP